MRRGLDHLGFLAVGAGRILDGATIRVEALGPCHRNIVLAGDELSGFAVEHIEEAVLGRVQQNLANLPINFQIGQDDVLGCREVPGVARRLLEVPGHFARVGLDGDDGRDIKIVSAAGRAEVSAPRRAVAGADVEQVEVRVVGHGVPDRAAAAHFPVFPALRVGLPCGHCSLEMFAFRREAWIARDRVEAPELATRLGVVGGDVAAHTQFTTAIADDDLVLDDARRTGDRIGLAAVDRVDVPDGLACLCIERHEASVDGSDIDPSLPDSDAPVHDIAAGLAAPFARDFGVIGPQLLAGLCVERVDDAPRAGRKHHPVLDDR